MFLGRLHYCLQPRIAKDWASGLMVKGLLVGVELQAVGAKKVGSKSATQGSCAEWETVARRLLCWTYAALSWIGWPCFARCFALGSSILPAGK